MMANISRPIVHLILLFVFLLCYSFASVDARRRCIETVTSWDTQATTTTEYVDSYATVTNFKTITDVVTSLTTILATETTEVVATDTITQTVYTAPLRKRSFDDSRHARKPDDPRYARKPDDPRYARKLDDPRYARKPCKTVFEYSTTINTYTETSTIVHTSTANPETHTTITEVETEHDTTTKTETVSTKTYTVLATDNAYLCSSSLFKEDVSFDFSDPSEDTEITSAQVGDIDSAPDCCISCFGLPGCIAWEYQPSNCTVTAIINEPVKECGVPLVSFVGGTKGPLAGLGPCGVLSSA